MSKPARNSAPPPAHVEQIIRENERLKVLCSNRLQANWSAVLQTMIRCSAVVACIFFASHYLGGRLTVLDAKIDATISASGNAQINLDESVGDALDKFTYLTAVSAFFNVVALYLMWRGRRARQDLIKRFSPYIQREQEKSDPSPTPSHLGKDGRTNPRDIL